jgi:hypothetical protein
VEEAMTTRDPNMKFVDFIVVAFVMVFLSFDYVILKMVIP